MVLLKRLFVGRRTQTQQQVAIRAAQVIEKVIFDVGVDALVNGTLVLDKHFQPRFMGLMPLPRTGIIASIAIAQVPEAALFRAEVDAALCDRVVPAPVALDVPVRGLVQGLMREFQARSPAFRALP